MAAARASKWHCQVSLVVSPVVYEILYLTSRSCNKQECESESWKQKRWKRLNFCGSGSGSTLMKQTGSGSELGSVKFQEEQEEGALKI